MNLIPIEITNLGSEVSVLFLMAVIILATERFFKWFFQTYARPKKESIPPPTHPLCQQIISLSALFEAHEKSQAEQQAVVHNGLNTNAIANIKSINTNLIANCKSLNTNT